MAPLEEFAAVIEGGLLTHSSILDFIEILHNTFNLLMLEKGVGRFYE